MNADTEQRTLENLEAIAPRNSWAERLARIKTAELLRGHPLTETWNETATVKKERP